MSETSHQLAEQALSNLVDQFARPLDFLRELAQNSIDAGTPRIEISLSWEPDQSDPAHGVLQIQVDDFGEGMDEEIIDNQLTRLFSSTKEDDLTKIGKFGIGFTSIFAIRPEAVLLRTGRHGEYWELLFHADRSFDKVRVTEPVAGTKITLYKQMDTAELDRFVTEGRFVLGYWCEHSDVPITWWDKTGGDVPEAPQSADPFAAFAEPAGTSGPESVNRPLELDDAVLQIRSGEGETEVVAGFCDPPRYGFYNGGLTLLASRSTDCLGTFDETLRHVSFKVKNDRLEHTLTRDNVLQDDHWEKVMASIGAAREALVRALLDRIEQAVADPSEDLTLWHRWLARDCAARPESARTEGLLDRRLFRDHASEPLTLAKIAAQERDLGFILLASGQRRLDDAVAAMGQRLLPDAPATRELLFASDTPGFLDAIWGGARSMRRADAAFVMPEILDGKVLSPEERVLADRCTHLLRHAVGLRMTVPAVQKVISWAPSVDSMANRIGVRVGDFGGVDLGTDEVLALNGRVDTGVFLRPGPTWSALPSFLRWRTLLVNRNHPLFRTAVLATSDDPDLAAVGLAQALLTAEGIEPERSYRWLLEGTLDDWGLGAER